VCAATAGGGGDADPLALPRHHALVAPGKAGEESHVNRNNERTDEVREREREREREGERGKERGRERRDEGLAVTGGETVTSKRQQRRDTDMSALPTFATQTKWLFANNYCKQLHTQKLSTKYDYTKKSLTTVHRDSANAHAYV
jgi:hypothetical protein